MALLNVKTSIVVETQLGEHITLYYPPLLHLLSLSFFLLLPSVDPYLIMKVMVSLIDGLQIFPIYYIVKDFSKSTFAAAVAGFLAMTAPSDFHMISWGGYANIAGLILIATSVYFIMKNRPVYAGVVLTALFLTHHLSMLFAVAILVPYFALVWVKNRKAPRCLLSLVVALCVAYAAFYWYTLIPLYDLYTTYAPRYAEFVLPSSWPQMLGVPLLLTGVAGIGFWAYRSKSRIIEYDWLLLIWFLMPLLLGYAYLIGVEWHAVRWLYFVQQPACVWAGMAISRIKYQKMAITAILIIFAFQWILTMQGYYADVSSNAIYSY
jgi:hypothetical protein